MNGLLLNYLCLSKSFATIGASGVARENTHETYRDGRDEVSTRRESGGGRRDKEDEGKKAKEAEEREGIMFEREQGNSGIEAKKA
jgi:hypothetical protein